MNILFLDQFGGLGGGQQCLRDLIPGIIARGWTAHVGLPSAGPLAQDIADAGAAVHEVCLQQYSNGRKTLNDVLRFAREAPRLATEIRRLMRGHRIDVLYVNGPRLLPAAAMAGDKLVFHSHNLLTTRYATLLAGISLRKCHATAIASSRFVAEPLRCHLPPERLQIIYNGVRDYGLEAGPRPMSKRPAIGVIGRIAPEKGQLDFVRAARLVVHDMPSCRFIICGDPQHSGDSYLSDVRDAASGFPIEFMDWQTDIAPVLRRLDIIVVPSMPLDATPRVILEAFSAGVPVIAYPSGGLTELIEHRTNGILTGEPAPESLAVALKALLTDSQEMQRLAHNARRCYLSRFTLERFRKDVVAVLERI
jgi:glycosyltransferase involved in cell wall biosynthesis